MSWIAGIDESGTGAWAGNFYLAVVIAPREWSLTGVRDSKCTTAAHREEVVQRMEQEAVLHFESAATPDDIEALGHSGAYLKAFTEVVRLTYWHHPRGEQLEVVVDGLRQQKLVQVLENYNLPYSFMKQADRHVQHVSAASIFAKYHRDVDMNLLDIQYPQYKFGAGAGYGTPEHILAIQKHGALPHVHRPLVYRRT